MILVQVIASTDFVAAISKLLLPLACVVCRLEPGQSPDANAVVIIYANTRVSVPYAKTYAATGAAAWLRHEGYTNPIVWLAGEPLELKTTPGDPIAHTSAQMDGGKIDLPWFAPLYDVALCLPQENGRLREAVQTAEGRIGKRRPLVEAAITRALQTHLESQGVYEDHLWKNLQAVLRFLRGAQCEWMIHPHDAQKIIKTIKRQVDLNATHPDFKAWAAEADSLLAKQTERWMNYKVAFVRLSRGTQVKPFAKMKRAGLPYRLLLVDDQWERLGWKVLLERLLAPYGFAVEADDGQSGAALEKRLKATKYDVVLLDLNLKSVPKLAKGERDSDDGKRTQESDDLTGLEHLKVFRQFAPQTPIIYFTSYERMSLERERQELGVLGYIVKQEDVSQQDARGYYKRLVELCHNTVDHEIRSLLRQLSQYWVERNPALYEEIGGRFDRSLKELDDPLITCHQSGLVYEGVLCDHLNMEFNKACREFGRLQGHSFSNWAMIGRLLRNAGAHRESGAEYLRLLDAHWSVFWATFVLIRLSDTGRSVGKINPCASERLVFLTLCRCHDVLKQVLGKYSYVLSALDLALSTRVLDKLDEANCELLDMALKFKHNPSQDLWPGFQQLTMLAGEVLLNASHSCCSRPGSDLISAAQCLRNACGCDVPIIDSSGNRKGTRYEINKNFEKMAAGAFVYLNELRVLQNIVAEAPFKNSPVEHRLLCFLMLTRLIEWAVCDVAAQANPGGEAKFQSNLDAATVAITVPGTLPLADEVAIAVKEPQLSAVLVARGERCLSRMTQQSLVQPALNSLQQLEKHYQKEIETLEEEIKTLKYQSLLNRISKCREIVEEARPRFEEIAQEKGVAIEVIYNQRMPAYRNLQALEAKLSNVDGNPNVESMEPNALSEAEATSQMQALEQKLKGLLEALQENRVSTEELKQLKNRLAKLQATAPERAVEAVRRLSPASMPEWNIVRACVHSWSWTPHREDLPNLLNDLEKRWKRSAVV